MKRLLHVLVLLFISATFVRAQCVPNCSSYTVSPITYSQFPNTGTDISSSLVPNIDDGYTGQIPLGFNFNYYCTTYSTVLICSNGFIVFGPTAPPINGADPTQSLPNSLAPNGMVCLNMNDFDVGAGGSITYTTVGTSPNQMFIVTYSAVPIWYNSGTNTPSVPVYNSGQIVLFEGSNNIEVHSASIGMSPYAMTQGIENQGGNVGVPAPGRNNSFWTTTNTAYHWENTLMGLPPSGLTGNTVACVNDFISFSVNTHTDITSYNWTFPSNWPNPMVNANTASLIATNSGTLSISASYSACGSSSAVSLFVLVNPLPIISVNSVTPSLVCSGNQAVFSPIGAATYTVDPGGISGTPPFTITAAANTAYSVSGTSAAGCLSAAQVVVPLIVEPTPTITVNSGSICLGQTFIMTPTGATNYTYSSLFPQVTPSITGTFAYFILGATASGFCQSQAQSNLTVNPVPLLGIVATRTAACKNETVSLTAQGASTYTWANNNSTLTAQTLTVTATVEYTLNGTNSFGCSAEMKKFVSLSPCTGINEYSNAVKTLLVYPNPSSGEYNLQLEQPTDITVMDPTGKVIYSVDDVEGQLKIVLGEITPGVYLLKATSEQSARKAVLIKN